MNREVFWGAICFFVGFGLCLLCNGLWLHNNAMLAWGGSVIGFGSIFTCLCDL